ncbi:MAG: ATP-binding cassette domain-containing protein [Gammaproteobacteria bacterium]|nr:ATP-binding cassette domain-containing protein [Gammaproteobacteria bacterium]
MSNDPLLVVEDLVKEYRRGILKPEVTFRLEASFRIEEPAIVGMMGPNGSGKTTLFELITGSNAPTAGRVLCAGQDIHDVRSTERDRLAIHYHQSYQVRHFHRRKPNFLMQHAHSDYPLVHLFDEPQFNTQDGYIGFMLDFFRRLRREGRLVFLCVHPNEPFHLDIMREVCERYVFVNQGRLSEASSFEALLEGPAVRTYLGRLAEGLH